MFKIIQVCQNDLEQAALLFNQYRRFYNMSSDMAAANHFIHERLVQQDSLIFLSLQQELAVGFMQVYPSFSSVAMQPIWILNDLFVEPSARRTGCAKKMMEYLQIKAKQEGIFSIKLATAVNNKKAKALYHTLGYQLNRDFDNYSRRIQ